MMNSQLDNININREKLTSNVEKYIKEVFLTHTKKKLGQEKIDNYLGKDFQCISLSLDKEIIGAITFRNKYSSLDIKYLVVSEKFRGNNLGKKLVEEAIKVARNEWHCRVAYLSTFSFQALDFYKKLGFEVEFIRDQYDDNIKNYFLKKVL